MIDSGVDVIKSLLELERVVSDSDLNEVYNVIIEDSYCYFYE